LASALLSVLEDRDAVVLWNDEPAIHEFLFSASATLRANIRETVDPLEFSVQGGEAKEA
jgi:hypothetical protein